MLHVYNHSILIKKQKQTINSIRYTIRKYIQTYNNITRFVTHAKNIRGFKYLSTALNQIRMRV